MGPLFQQRLSGLAQIIIGALHCLRSAVRGGPARRKQCSAAMKTGARPPSCCCCDSRNGGCRASALSLLAQDARCQRHERENMTWEAEARMLASIAPVICANEHVRTRQPVPWKARRRCTCKGAAKEQAATERLSETHCRCMTLGSTLAVEALSCQLPTRELTGRELLQSGTAAAGRRVSQSSARTCEIRGRLALLSSSRCVRLAAPREQCPATRVQVAALMCLCPAPASRRCHGTTSDKPPDGLA